MKISNQQIDALSQKVFKEINSHITSENNKKLILVDNFIKSKINKSKTLKEIYEDVEYPNNSSLRRELHNYIRHKYNAQLKDYKSCGVPCLHEIRNEIIVGTIGEENLEELLKNIKANYNVNTN